MNAKDRKRLNEQTARLNALIGELESIDAELSELADAEEEKFGNLSEGLQQAEFGAAMEQAAADAVKESKDGIENTMSDLNDL